MDEDNRSPDAVSSAATGISALQSSSSGACSSSSSSGSVIASSSSSSNNKNNGSSSSEECNSNQHDSTIHLMPCTIEYDGNAQVKSFFHVQQETDGTLRSHFRGRELRGSILDLPSTAVDGLCIGDCGNRQWRVEGTFSQMSVWEHDTMPDMSPLQESLAWFALADAVHSTDT